MRVCRRKSIMILEWLYHFAKFIRIYTKQRAKHGSIHQIQYNSMKLIFYPFFRILVMAARLPRSTATKVYNSKWHTQNFLVRVFSRICFIHREHHLLFWYNSNSFISLEILVSISVTICTKLTNAIIFVNQRTPKRSTNWHSSW